MEKIENNYEARSIEQQACLMLVFKLKKTNFDQQGSRT